MNVINCNLITDNPNFNFVEIPDVISIIEDQVESSAQSQSRSSGEDLCQKKICDGSLKTVEEFNTEFLSIVSQHKLSDQASKDLLNLISTSLPIKNNCPTFYNLNKQIKNEVKVNCSYFKSESCEYYTLPIQKQIESILKRNFNEILFYAENLKQKTDAETINDLCHGMVYKNLFNFTSLKNELTIHLLLNSDGALLIKSKKSSFWPVLASIAELPPELRSSYKNLILGAVWGGDTKPQWNKFLQNFALEMSVLKNGFYFNYKTQLILVKVKLFCLIADMPAKASIVNIQQFNSYYGCSQCYAKGKYVSRRMIFPFQNTIKLRNNKEYIHCAKIAEESQTPYFGVKGSCLLSEFLSIPESLLIDYMHQCLLGVGKTLILNLISNKTVISALKLEELNATILSVQYPSDFKRHVKSLHELTFWKAQEYKIFLFYIAPIIFSDLNNNYYNLLLKFIIGIRLLCEDVTVRTVSEAKHLLENFCETFPRLFGIEYQSYNLHSLLHLPDQVLNFGPLWCTSAMTFESAIYQLKHSVSGTVEQLRSMIKHFCLNKYNLTKIKNSKHKNFVQINNSCFISPSNSKIPLTINNVSLHLKCNNTDLVVCDRVIYEHTIYHSINYNRRKSSNNYTVLIDFNGLKVLGKILYFCFCKSFNTLVAYLQCYKTFPNPHKMNDNKYLESYFYCIKETEMEICVYMKDILKRCLVLNHNNLTFLATLNRDFEHD